MYTKYTGIILKKHPLGEADELLTIFTREIGKLRVVTRGARKIKSRLAGALQSLNEIEFETATSRHRGGGLPVLISVRVQSINNYLRENLKKFAYALVGIETLYRLTGDGQENKQAYTELGNFLRNIGQSNEENLEVRIFQLRLLSCCGYDFPRRRPLPDKLTPEIEKEIDQFLNYVLEREIRSNKFVNDMKE